MEHKYKHALKFALLIAILAAAIYFLRFSPYAEKISAEALREFVYGFGVYGFLVFILIYAVGAALSIPGTLLTFVGAILYGTWMGSVVNLIGATLGASIAFFAAKYLGRDFCQRLMKGRLNEFQKKVEKNGFNVILLLRLIPLFPYIGINYASGLVKIKFRDYFLATLIGMIPGVFIYTYLFATLGEKILTQGFQFTDLLTFEVALPIVLFAGLIIISSWYKKAKN